MNILILIILFALILNILRMRQIITLEQKYIIIMTFICLSLVIAIYVKIHPTFIPKNKNLTNRCFINEKKNKLGPHRCFFDSDCRGNRRCSSEGKCIGNAMC